MVDRTGLAVLSCKSNTQVRGPTRSAPHASSKPHDRLAGSQALNTSPEPKAFAGTGALTVAPHPQERIPLGTAGAACAGIGFHARYVPALGRGSVNRHLRGLWYPHHGTR